MEDLRDDELLCPVEFDPVGTINFDIDRPTGNVTNFIRNCEHEYSSVYQLVTSVDEGGGSLVCSAP
jgi:hypothetical protein